MYLYGRAGPRGLPGPDLRSGPGINILASPDVTNNFVNVIQGLRPEGAVDSQVFSTVLQHDGHPMRVELYPDGSYQQLLAPDKLPLGLAVAHDVIKSRRLLWRGLTPGLFAVSKTVFAKEPENPASTDPEAHVQEDIQSRVRLGRRMDRTSTRRATHEEVVGAIDAIFMAAAEVTTTRPSLHNRDTRDIGAHD